MLQCLDVGDKLCWPSVEDDYNSSKPTQCVTRAVVRNFKYVNAELNSNTT